MTETKDRIRAEISAMRCGRSFSTMEALVKYCSKHPSKKVVFISLNPGITWLGYLKVYMADTIPGVKYNSSCREFTFVNGSTLRFINSLDKIRGQEFSAHTIL